MEGRKISCNSKFISFISSSGTTLQILNLTKAGRQISSLPSLGPHGQHIQDQGFDPFNQNRVASVCSDGKLRVWNIPQEGLLTSMNSPLEYQTKSKNPLRGLAWHPTSSNVIAVRGSRNLYVFDLESGSKEEVLSTVDGCFGADILSFCWSYDGSSLFVSCKDKIIRVIDPRKSGQDCVLQASSAGQSHGGIRFCGITCLGNAPIFLTSGHSTNQDRELRIWDNRNLSRGSLSCVKIDNGNISPLFSIFDSDTSLLTVFSKGGSALRLYELRRMDEDVELVLLRIEQLGIDAVMGCALLPKQANALLECEILRHLRLVVSTTGNMAIQPVSIKVPRKDKCFHSELFPDTTIESPPAQTCSQYFAGENALPLKTAVVPTTSTSITPDKSSGAVSPTRAAKAPAEPSAAEKEDQAHKNLISHRLLSLGSSLKFKHLQIKYPVKDKTFFDLKPCKAQNEGHEIACSEQFWATAYSGGGGPVYVSRHESLGRIPSGCNVINGHSSSVTDIAFSPFDASVMATASADCTVNIWQLPHEGEIPRMEKVNASATLTGFGNSVRCVNFHPTCQNILACSSLDRTVKLFDIESPKELAKFELSSGSDCTVNNLSWNYDGSQYALASKDRVVRVVDPRSSQVVSQSPDNSVLGRHLRVEWCCNGSNACSTLLTVSAGTSGMRMIHCWDPRNWSAPLSSQQVDTASGQLYPMFDPSMGVCFIAGKGDTIVRAYEMNMMVPEGRDAVAVSCEKSSEFSGSMDRTTFTGVCMLPKRTCDIRNIECARLLKLTTESVVPVSLTLPRAENLKQYFQDDIFRPLPSSSQHHVAGDFADWLNSNDNEHFIGPFMESLQPVGMTPLSEKPAEEAKVSRVTSFREQKEAEEREKAAKDASFLRLQQMANQKASYHVNESMGADVVDSDDNWSDSD